MNVLFLHELIVPFTNKNIKNILKILIVIQNFINVKTKKEFFLLF